MPGMEFVLDPDGVDYALTPANGINVLAPVKSVPAKTEKLWTSNVDTEGELAAGGKKGNSQHTLTLRLTGESEEQFRLRQSQLEQKLDKLDDEGGVLRVVYPDTSYIEWEIRAIEIGDKLLDNRFVQHWRTQGEVTFICAPFGEEVEELLEEFSGEAQRALECIVEGVGGSAPALARAVVTSPDTDIWDLRWGRDSRRYSDAETAEAAYPATDLTPLGGASSTTATVDGVAETPVVRQDTLSPNWTAMLSTDISAVGAMTQEGTFEVIAIVHMPTGNTGEVGIAFEYDVGDALRSVFLDPIYFDADHPREGRVVQLSLGQVSLRAPANGTHSWQGRVLAKSSVAGDDLDVLTLALRPLSEGRGEVQVTPSFNQPTALLTRDEFAQTAGGLDGQTIAVAGHVTDPKSPGSAGSNSEAGEVEWAKPTRIGSSDDLRSTVSLVGGQPSEYLTAGNFGFEIPEGATITGVLVSIEKSKSGSWVSEYAVRLKNENVSLAANRQQPTAWTDTDQISLYGGSSDLWGQSLTPDDVNSVWFGAAIAVVGEGEARVDHISITVYYTDAGGQAWSTAGDATDLEVEEEGHAARRTAVSDVDLYTGRYALAGATELADMVVGVSTKRTSIASGEVLQGVLGRYSDTDNWLFTGFKDSSDQYEVIVAKCVEGSVTTLANATGLKSTDWRQVWLQVDSRGRWLCWGVLIEGGVPQLLLVGQDDDLAQGGALAEGLAGFYDAKTEAGSCTRDYDNFVVWTPPPDAVIYEGRSLELAHNRVERQTASGGWAAITPSGDYLKLEPEGMELRKNRLVFIASPNDPETMGVGFPVNLDVAIYATRRHRTIPDPA